MTKYVFYLFSVLLAVNTQAQVLDDSTKQIYSNKTVEFVYENDVLRNINRSFHPDSTLSTYHLANPNRKSGWLYQDLGNIGTASQSILFEKSLEAGQNMGLYVYRLYTPQTQQFKYYNTRSPYTYLGYQGGGGHTQIDITHSQNINPRLNLTFNLVKFNSEKQFGYSRVGEVLVNHWQYNLGTNYTSKNDKYKLLATFYHFNHKAAEQGGVKNGKSIALDNIESKYSRVYDGALSGAIFNRERWNNFHLFQQFLMKNTLQTFHILDYEQKYYGFEDPAFASEENAAVYGIEEPTQVDTLRYSYRFQTLSNKFGFKGIYKGFNYQAYGRYRLYRLNNPAFPSYDEPWTSEVFLGGLVGYVFKDSTNTLDIKAEVASNNNYFLDASLWYKGFDIGFYNGASPVGLFYQKFTNGIVDLGNTRSLKSVNSKDFHVKFPLKYKAFTFIPQVRWSSISNYTYLEDVFTAKQTDKDINLMHFILEAKYQRPRFALSQKYYLNKSNNEDVYPVPNHISITNLDFNFLYARVLRIHTGFDLYYKSAYYANEFSPLLNQFYVSSQEQKVGGVPVADWYIKFPMSKGRIALNWSFFNKGLGRNGVFTTPGYLSNPSSLMLKIDWPLFD